MRSLLFFLLSLVIFCLALSFHHTQKFYFTSTREAHTNLEQDQKALGEDLAFLRHYQPLVQFLKKRGWFIPQNRLIGAEKINQWANNLNVVRITIEPEVTKEEGDEYAFKVSRIILEVSTLLDTDVYNFSAQIGKRFPGILIFRKISVSRNEKINKSNLFSLRQNKSPHFIVGEVICEWVSMKVNKNEK